MLQQAKDYARILDLKFAYATNGREIIEFDFSTYQSIAEDTTRPLLDSLHFFNNSSDHAHLIFKEESGRVTVIDRPLFEPLRQFIKS